MKTINDLGDQWIQNILNEIEKTAKNSRKVPPSCFE